ncbi:hypothetical protein [Merismopedia glauca]|uniref:hypothetical protein n=1 Tax=Merismopedia glauca TaxID=292586 RepID=UPI0015E6BE03|nr:hypothetical protein [Merismopedia glauca]
MSSLREAYIAIALEVQERLSQEYLGKFNLEISANLSQKNLKITEEYQPKAS